MARLIETTLLNQHGKAVKPLKLPNLQHLSSRESGELQENLFNLRLAQGCYVYKSVPDVWGFLH